MEYFVVEKLDKKVSLEKKIKLEKGYKFTNKIVITAYNKTIINYILNKKIESSFRSILKKLLELDESDEDGVNELTIKLETLRNLILGKYFPFINKKKVKLYLLRISEIENKIPRMTNKKSKSR